MAEREIGLKTRIFIALGPCGFAYTVALKAEPNILFNIMEVLWKWITLALVACFRDIHAEWKRTKASFKIGTLPWFGAGLRTIESTSNQRLKIAI